MSKGHGHVERSILELLRVNEHLDAPGLAELHYQTSPELPTYRDSEELREPTAAELSAVRRALVKLRKQGAVVKLGNVFYGERCSYALAETQRAGPA
jgi:hypothetical protein